MRFSPSVALFVKSFRAGYWIVWFSINIKFLLKQIASGYRETIQIQFYPEAAHLQHIIPVISIFHVPGFNSYA
jgi:hypothetical protein